MRQAWGVAREGMQVCFELLPNFAENLELFQNDKGKAHCLKWEKGRNWFSGLLLQISPRHKCLGCRKFRA